MPKSSISSRTAPPSPFPSTHHARRQGHLDVPECVTSEGPVRRPAVGSALAVAGRQSALTARYRRRFNWKVILRLRPFFGVTIPISPPLITDCAVSGLPPWDSLLPLRSLVLRNSDRSRSDEPAQLMKAASVVKTNSSVSTVPASTSGLPAGREGLGQLPLLEAADSAGRIDGPRT